MKKKYFQPKCLYKKRTYTELIPFYELGIGVRHSTDEKKKAELEHKNFVRLCKLLKSLFAARNVWLESTFCSKLQMNRTRMCVYLATFSGILMVFEKRVSNIRAKMQKVMQRAMNVQTKKQDIADELAKQLVQLSLMQTVAEAPSPVVNEAQEAGGDRLTCPEVEIPVPAASERTNDNVDAIITYEEYEDMQRMDKLGADKTRTERVPEQVQIQTDDQFVPYRIPIHGKEDTSDEEPQINIVVHAEVHEIPAAHRGRADFPGIMPSDIAPASSAFAFDPEQEQLVDMAIRVGETDPLLHQQLLLDPHELQSSPIIDQHVHDAAPVPADRERIDDLDAIITYEEYEKILQKELEEERERSERFPEQVQEEQTHDQFVPYRPPVHRAEELSDDEEPQINIVVQAEVHEIPAAYRKPPELSSGIVPEDIASTSTAFEAFKIDDQGPQLGEQAILGPAETSPAPVDDVVQVSAPALPDRVDDWNAIIPYEEYEEVQRKESEAEKMRSKRTSEQEPVQTADPFVPYRLPVHGREDTISDEEPQINIVVQAEVYEIPAAHREQAEVAPPEPQTEDIPQIVIADADPTPDQRPDLVSHEPQSAPTDQQAASEDIFTDFVAPRPLKRASRARKRSASDGTPEPEAPPRKKRHFSSYTWYLMNTLKTRYNREEPTKFKLSPAVTVGWSMTERSDENCLGLHWVMNVYRSHEVGVEEASRFHANRKKALVAERYPKEAPPPPQVSAPRWSRKTRSTIEKKDVGLVSCDEEEIIKLMDDAQLAEIDEFRMWEMVKDGLLESRARGRSLAQTGRKSSILGVLAQSIRQFQRTPRRTSHLELPTDPVAAGRLGDLEVPLEAIQAVVLAPPEVETEKVERSAILVAPEEFLVPADVPTAAPPTAESQAQQATAMLDQPIEISVEPIIIPQVEVTEPTTRAEDVPGGAVQVPTVAGPPTTEPTARAEDVPEAAVQVPPVAGPSTTEPRVETAPVVKELKDGIMIGGRTDPSSFIPCGFPPVESRDEVAQEVVVRPVTLEEVDDEPARSLRSEGIKREDVERNVKQLKDDNVAVVSFADMCPPATTTKKDAARTLMNLLRMHKKKVVLDVDPNTEKGADAILIHP